jgi:PKD repeat protein
LDGTGSFDIDPTDYIFRYGWELDGVFPYDFDDAVGPNPVHVWDTPGLYNVGLKVWDNGVLNDLDEDGVVDENERLTDIQWTTITVGLNQAPVADANGPYTVDEGSLVTLDGTGSRDPDGHTITYAWDLDGDGQYDDATGATPEFTGLDDGTYTVGLMVSDSALEDTATAEVTVNNVAPTVEAGPDQEAIEGNLVQFNGSFTDPGTLDTHTIDWDFGDGETASTTLTPSHVYADNGIYTVTLTVTDDDGGAGSDTLTVTVNNVPPTADAGPDQVTDEGNTAIDFRGAYTDPAINDTHTVKWDFGDGSPEVTGTLTPSHTYPADDGNYTVTLTVTDDDGGVGSDTLKVEINNVAPTVEAGLDQEVLEGNSVQFNGSFTDPGALDTHTIEWDFGDENTANASLQPTHVYTTPGNYTATLTVTDDDGGVGSDTLIVTVQPSNQPPVADAGGPYTVNEGSEVSLDASGSSDPDPDDALTYEWDLDNDGEYDDVTGETPTYTWMDDGSYSVGLMVTDTLLLSDTDTTTVTVNNVAPTVDAGPDGTINEGSAFSGAGSFTDPGADSWAATVNYGDGSGLQALSLSLDRTFGLSHVYDDNGVYTVTVTVTDDDGGVGSDSLTVTVNNVAPAVDAGPDSRFDEGSSFVSSGLFTDPGADTWMATVDYGDGSNVQALSLSADKTFAVSHLYGDNGVYTVTVTVTDDDGSVGSDTMTVTVNNVAPVVDAGPDATINEGRAYASAGSFTDPGSDSWTATVDYGDGSDVEALTLNADKSFILDHVYMDDGVYTVTVTVTDDDGGIGSDAVAVTVNDLGPAAAFTWTPEPQTEGSAVNFTDASTSSPDAIVGWSWDFAGLGTSTDQNPAFTFMDHGTHTVTLTVTDDDGSTDTVSHPVTITDLGPTAFLTGDTALNEGQAGQCNASGSTSFPDAIIGYGWDWNYNGTTFIPSGDTGPSQYHAWMDNGTYTVAVRVTDDDGSTDIAMMTVTVNNVAPSVDAGPDGTINEGSAFSSAGSFTDPGADSWTGTVDYGDGSEVQPLSLNPDKTFAVSHV